ncbi:biotin carboxylase [Rhizobiales bacterium TNE-4]|nr:biotin carboxylase [Rhizobiales bacterium TNE-4]MBV1827324.1 biotin carboxylase [Rhizobiales bacterium TNE-4]
MSRPITKLLIANRGEIAVRVIRTAQRLGIATVLVCHELDLGSPASVMADEIVMLEGRTGVAAYLDAAQILAAAQKAGADAIHPGYGFLSENAAFAKAVSEAGLIFVGPTAAMIDLMGDKVRARAFAQKHGVPVAPSVIEDDDPVNFVAKARALGAPLLVKPSAGGGGKGMRIVRDMAKLDEEIAQARSEGARYFGDGRLYVERFVEEPRHIEVQVFGDGQGHVIHLGERECSAQRRFQKIIEETPSPVLTPDLRARICQAAVDLARAAHYANAGTVEFIYGRDEFYFLEMNTRLQVEHPVTEEVTGLDLVEWQLRIAAGEGLPCTQSEIRSNGHAIELRIYAESPSRGFLPTTGPLLVFDPPEGEGVRIDTGFVQGQRVTSAFDPMLAKLIIHAPDRSSAIDRACDALREFVILGCETNIEFLGALTGSSAFRSGDVHTGFIDANPHLAQAPDVEGEALMRVLGAACMALPVLREEAEEIPTLHAMMGGWRN